MSPLASLGGVGDGRLVAWGEGLLAAQALLFVVLLGAVIVVALARWWQRRRAHRVEVARDRLANALTQTGALAQPLLAELSALPASLQEQLVLEFGRTLRGDALERLRAMGRHLGLVARARRACGSRLWWRRLQGARLLGAFDHDCPALRRLLDDPNPTVRVEVLHWAAGRADAQVVQALVDRLVDPERLCRFTVRDSLLHLGPPAAVALADLLGRDDVDASDGSLLVDALLVARGLAHPVLLDPVLALAGHAAADVRARAIHVLGAIGSERAVVCIVAALDDVEAVVRQAAARAIGELGHWDAAMALAARLGDPSFPVRREAALSLRRLGSVGVLVLRRACGDANPFVADMSRQVLDLPDSVFHRVAA